MLTNQLCLHMPKQLYRCNTYSVAAGNDKDIKDHKSVVKQTRGMHTYKPAVLPNMSAAPGMTTSSPTITFRAP